MERVATLDHTRPLAAGARGGVQCVLDGYVAPDQQFLLYHNDAVGYGWTASEIRLFESGDGEKCLGMPYTSMYIQNLKVPRPRERPF